jgi:hypothetical protein
MTETESLITKARRYCTENFSYWSKKYQAEMSGNNNPYSNNDYNLFPRYNTLNTILQGVEVIVGKDFESFEQCKEELKRIGNESHSINTIESNKELHLLGKMSKFFGKSGKLNKIEKNAIQDERRKFIEFIDSTNLESLIDVEPLPYERKLDEEESELIREQLLKIWNFDGDYWEPLESKSPKPTIFLMNDNFNETDKKEIESSIKEHLNSDKLFVITEDRIDYEVEVSLLDIGLYETIICDNTFEWVVYGSHESTTAFGGEFLINKLNQLFESRKDKLSKWEQNW